MADDPQTAQATPSKLNIPEETRKQFPDLAPLIEQSSSMNDEERQYWIDVLPIMTEDQLDNLRDILGTEKKQIAEADKTYAKGVQKEADKVKMAFDEGAYRAKKQARVQAEQQHEEDEKKHEDQLLKDIETMEL
ncbi:MAG: hypothetical protein V1760_01185 [Candidatus Peregrinibacteria bacterium]